MPAAARALRSQLLELAHQLLVDAEGSVSEPIHVIVQTTRSRLEFISQPGELAAAATLPDGLSPMERAILRVATRTPQVAKVLARLADYSCNSHFRGILTSLCRRAPPLLLRTPDGYRLPDST